MCHSEVGTQSATGSSTIPKIFKHTSIPECTLVLDAYDMLFLSNVSVIIVGSALSAPMGARERNTISTSMNHKSDRLKSINLNRILYNESATKTSHCQLEKQNEKP
jgi:hypothetical protein